MTPQDFVESWKGRNLTERESSQSHFRQLCDVLGVPAPYDNRAEDENYKFDAITAAAGSRPSSRSSARTTPSKGLFGDLESDGAPALSAQPETSPTRIVSAPSGTHGYADVWKRGCFCWEYKRQGQADLSAALDQLKRYRDSLDNPPLLIVCDVDTFEIHTNFTGYPMEFYQFSLEDLADPSDEWLTKRGISPLNLLRKAFDPAEALDYFRPKRRLDDITQAFAGRVAALAQELDPAKTEDGQPVSRQEVAHFLMQIVFSLFAEDIGLLPRDRVTRLLQQGNSNPKDFTRRIRSLFKAMEKGGDFGEDTIDWFNGGLFKDVERQKIPRLAATQLGIFVTGEDKNWSAIEPSILGTLFERALDPGKRAQIGAHYTSRDDIMLIIEPVVLAPLRREWKEVQTRVVSLVATRDKARTDASRKAAADEIREALRAFHKRLSTVTILDPACGSGNFLYVAIQNLLDLELEVINFAALREIGVTLKPKVSPTQLRGIEINEYAAELARISIWIGYLKWKKEKASYDKERPILAPLDTIENRDAILDRSRRAASASDPSPPKSSRARPSPSPTKPTLPLATPARWPVADFIIGNPPFLGSKLFRRWGLTDDYLKDLFALYELPKTSDLCCYWFEKARQAIEKNPATRAGLLATQGIRGGDNRTVLERIKKSGDISMAWSDREWVLDGAAVQVSMIGFGPADGDPHFLDGRQVAGINADLTSGTNTSASRRLNENAGIAFMGDTKGGPFDIEWTEAASLLSQVNVNRRSNADVVRPWVNGLDVTRRGRGMFIVDFGCDTDKQSAAAFEGPFSHVERFVLPERKDNRRATYAERWWIHVEPRPALRAKIEGLRRFLCTPTLTKFRLFGWQDHPTIPDHQLIVFGRDDDYFFGALHSSPHEVWARNTGTQLREAESGFRYTPSSTFETFPLPWPPGKEPASTGNKHHALLQAISRAARELNDFRESWLNPQEWVAEVEALVDIRHRVALAAVPAKVRPLVRRSAVMTESAKHSKLKSRTLTNLYNERPAWLRLAHEKLDRAVLAAYWAVDPKGGWDPDWASVYEPFGAGEITIKREGKGRDSEALVRQKEGAAAARAPVDAKILAALLRLNGERAGG